MNYIITRTNQPNELYHHGVKGMKWGKRKAQSEYHQSLSRAKSTYKSNKKKIDAGYTKAAEMFDKKTNGGRVRNKTAEQAFDKAADKWAADRKSAKADYKNTKASIKKQAVKSYEKQFNKAEKASNVADKKWNQVNEQYHNLGKTKVTRMINAARNKTDAAKSYNREYDKASNMSDSADKLWSDAKKLYEQTGRNRVERIFNNVKYGS